MKLNMENSLVLIYEWLYGKMILRPEMGVKNMVCMECGANVRNVMRLSIRLM